MKVTLEIDISDDILKEFKDPLLDRGKRQNILDNLGELYKQVAMKEIQLRFGVRSVKKERNKIKC